jgi:hypothetical protein
MWDAVKRAEHYRELTTRYLRFAAADSTKNRNRYADCSAVQLCPRPRAEHTNETWTAALCALLHRNACTGVGNEMYQERQL